MRYSFRKSSNYCISNDFEKVFRWVTIAHFQMNSTRSKLVGVDLFTDAGGMSLRAKMAGIDVLLAVENDKHAAATYASNHPEPQLFIDDIRNFPPYQND